MDFLTTKELAKKLSVNYATIQKAIFNDRISPPKKTGGGYLWDRAAAEQVSWKIRHRPIDDVWPKQRKGRTFLS